METYASVTALISQTKEMMEKHPESKMHEIAKINGKVNGRTSFDAAKMGDSAALEVVRQYTEYVGMGVTDFINIFQPEAVVIGGGISKEGDYLLDPVRKYAAENSYGINIKKPKIIAAKLGNDAGIIGAAMLWTLYK